jgi:hypothetical protein
VRNFLRAISQNRVALLGAALTTSAALIFVSLFGLELAGLHTSVYTGIITYMGLPSLFVFGLVLIPLGLWRARWVARHAPTPVIQKPTLFPIIDFNENRTLRVAAVVLGLTLMNLALLATATYKGVEVMESTAFCGATCHTVMQPEYTAYQRSPHARVACVACHIGPGADWFAKSKLSGAWQVIAVALNLYPRPIPTPIQNLRPARETCEQCHWPSKFVGDRLKVLTHFAEDEKNTELKTVLLVRVGGVEGRKSQGIHWHVAADNNIRYKSDPGRETIYAVELSRSDGSKKVYETKANRGQAVVGAAEEWRTMDCIDCHNRPTHIYRTPEMAIDEALLSERLPRGLPFIRKEGLALLQAKYPSHEDARSGIAAALAKTYAAQYADVAAANGELLAKTGKTLGDIYCENVFPAMAVYWGTYANHLGHKDGAGCFRCHDEEHVSDKGETISQDCSTCHSLLAEEEASPSILTQLNP